jgi:hypothetical protein
VNLGLERRRRKLLSSAAVNIIVLFVMKLHTIYTGLSDLSCEYFNMYGDVICKFVGRLGLLHGKANLVCIFYGWHVLA